MINTRVAYPRPFSLPSQRAGSNSALLAGTTVVFAAGFVSNDKSYLLLPVLIGISCLMQRRGMSQSRFVLILATLLLAFYGAFLGLFKGHNVVYIIKFFAPILVFAVLLTLRNLGPTLYARRRPILMACFVISALFTVFIKLWIAPAIALFMAGWTTHDIALTAVSVFHYFALAFCLVQIFEFVAIRRSGAGLVRTLVAITTIALLVYLTSTSAFYLAVAVGIAAILARFFRFAILIRVMFVIILVLLVDYFTLQYVTRSMENYLLVAATSDEGNSIRMLQVQYFVERVSLFGEGFGAEHAFTPFQHAGRQQMQERFPYSSELPILNIINGAGIIAAVWFYLAVKPIFHCLTNIRARDPETATKAYFGLACGLVLVGSISNPFFFSPVSMLMLCVATDLRVRPGKPV